MTGSAQTLPVAAGRARSSFDARPYYVLFFFSGFPALLYQIIWQRALFTIYGVNIESVTVIVTVFMLGLGLGSLAGGWVSKNPSLPLLLVFGVIELCVGAFGAISIPLFHQVAVHTSGAGAARTALVTFFLLLLPTLLMGSTLPLLVGYFVRNNSNVGESVGALYAVNTVGSAAACFVAALFAMRAFGESGSVRLAMGANAAVGGIAVAAHFLSRRKAMAPPPVSDTCNTGLLPLPVAIVLSAMFGFIALAYEIVWYRIYSFASAGAAPSFALLLGFYLGGIAYGSMVVRHACRAKLRLDRRGALRVTGMLILWANIVGFLLGPAVGIVVKVVPYSATYEFVFVGASLMGACFPLLSHAGIDPRGQAGSSLSYMYLANIIGSAAGSFVVGFILMDSWSIRAICSFLLACGVALALATTWLSGRFCWHRALAIGLAVAAGLLAFSGPLFSGMYARLLWKNYSPAIPLRAILENRHGVIAVTSDAAVFGGGVYDGRFNTDLWHDTNGIVRAYAVAGLHPHPREVLVVGLSSGSWAQVIVNHPRLEKMTVVEINPGYLQLIAGHPDVASLLHNPKVEMFIDDGRRWLIANPGRQFDVIVMNTTWNWRANASNLLSTEFLKLIRAHLKPGGVHYYNTTDSGEALLTGAAEFPYAWRFMNFLAVSDRPIAPDKQLLRQALEQYRIDGRPVLNLGDPSQVARLNQVLGYLDDPAFTESGPSLRSRWHGKRMITDDNMGTEWQ